MYYLCLIPPAASPLTCSRTASPTPLLGGHYHSPVLSWPLRQTLDHSLPGIALLTRSHCGHLLSVRLRAHTGVTTLDLNISEDDGNETIVPDRAHSQEESWYPASFSGPAPTIFLLLLSSEFFHVFSL